MRTISPAPISSTSESATSETTSTLRVLPPLASELPRLPCFSASFTSVRVKRSEGIKPASTPVKIETTRVNTKTCVSSVTSTKRGSRSASIFTISPMLARARSNPRAPPATDNTTVSAKMWRTMATRPAPKAVRIAISLRRAKVFAKTRFATFAHAISKTKATAPKSTSSAGRMSPTSCSRKGIAVAPQPLSSAGYCCSSLVEIAPSSDLACSIATPGFRRPMTM